MLWIAHAHILPLTKAGITNFAADPKIGIFASLVRVAELADALA